MILSGSMIYHYTMLFDASIRNERCVLYSELKNVILAFEKLIFGKKEEKMEKERALRVKTSIVPS